MTSLRHSLLAVASVCLLVSACTGGSGETGAAGSSGGGTGGATGAAGTGSGTAGASGTSGAAGAGGTTGSAGAGGNGAAGTGGAGTAGTTGSAGQSGSAGTTGIAGSGGRGGTGGAAGTTGVAGQGGSAGAGGSSAGRGGTGGQAGSAAGAGGRGGTTGSAGTGGATATGFFSDGFESGTVGMQASGWNNFIAYQANGPNPNGQTLALVDSARAHTGTKSMHVHGGSAPAQITRALPTGTNKLYVRAYIYLVRQLGGNTAVNGINHETLIGIRKTSGNAGDEVRFGETKGYVGTLDALSDDWSPKLTQPTTAVVAANRWACFEVGFLADQTQHTVSAWVDGTLIHSITSTPAQWEHGSLSASWMTGKFGEVILGWQSFSNVDTDVWIDDVVLSTSPVGCQ